MVLFGGGRGVWDSGHEVQRLNNRAAIDRLDDSTTSAGSTTSPRPTFSSPPQAWDHLLDTPHPEREAVLRRNIVVPGARWRLMDFEPTDDPELAPFTETFDVMGDGSLMVLPTPGHIAGSVSLLRHNDAAPILLIGDLTYSEELLQRGEIAGTGDKKALLESYAQVRALRANTPELVIIASHDTTAADKLAANSAVAT